MKKVLIMMVILVSMNSYGGECPIAFGNDDYMDKVLTAIESKKSCTEENEITEACAMGSSMDVQFVNSALKQCTKRVNRSATVKKAVYDASNLCTKKYARSSGTLAMSARAFCQLEVTMLYDNLLAPPEL